MQSHSEYIPHPACDRSCNIFQPEAGWKPIISRIKASLFKPILAPMFQNRWILHLLTIAAAIQMGLAAGGIQGWQCPIRSSVGIPCPGCGLSSAMASLIQGEWRVALQIHFFAPVFVMGFIFMGIFSVLPDRVYRKSLRWLDAFERGTGFATLLSIAMVVYWCFKMLEFIWG